MRIRTVKPEFHQDEEMSEVSAEAALLAIGLLNYADDEGWFKYHPKLIESSIFPLRELSVNIQGLLTELSNMGYFSLHEGSDGKKYGYIDNFLKHQRVNRPSSSKIATIIVESIDVEDSHNPHAQLSEDSHTERNREQGTGKGKEHDISSDDDCPKTDKGEPPNPQRGKWVADSWQKRINQLFNRRESTNWSDKEKRAYRKISILEEDMKLIEIYYDQETGCQYRRRDIQTLLNNWNGEVDRARQFKSNNTQNKAPKRLFNTV